MNMIVHPVATQFYNFSDSFLVPMIPSCKSSTNREATNTSCESNLYQNVFELQNFINYNKKL